jgi:prepilin-type processing-associated H-X9-DG protein
VITGELSAARQFMAAHQMYSNDFGGAVPAGFASDAMVRRGEVVARNDLGKKLSGLEAQRYPWRLLPYLGHELGLLYRDRERINEVFSGALRDYAVSVAPRMGLNQAFIGGSGDSDGTGWAFPASQTLAARAKRAWGNRWYVSKVAEARRPTDLIVFASAWGASPINGIELDGMYRVTPPSFTSRLWATKAPNESSQPGQCGNVSFRFGGRAACAMLDGHAATLDWTQMQDMRRWSPQADREDWKLPAP